MFGEVYRLKTEMGQYKYFEDDTRVVAHDDTVQDIRQNRKAVNKMFWGDKNIQIVALPEKCKGKIKSDWNHYPSGVVYNDQRQYYLILTCCVMTERQRSEREKLGRVRVHDNEEPDESIESDSDISIVAYKEEEDGDGYNGID